MKTFVVLIAVFLGLTSCAHNRWESEILAFEAQDKTMQPPKDAVVVTGSSTIRRWTSIRRDLAPLPIIARGFGGSTADDLFYYLDRIVLAYEPRAVVIYEGDNDLAFGKTPEYIADRFTAIARRIHARLPQTRIYIISIKPSLSRWMLWKQTQQTNLLLQALCAQDRRLKFIDVSSALLGADGHPRAEYFIADQLHLNPTGYAVWSNALRPILLQDR